VFETYELFVFRQVFDTTRKVTYKNLTNWYKELRQHRPEIPCVCGANKIDGKQLFVICMLVFYVLLCQSVSRSDNRTAFTPSAGPKVTLSL